MTVAPLPPPAVAAKPRRRWIVVLAGVLSLVVVMGIAGTVLFFTRTWPPLAATYDFTDDLQKGNTNAAFAQVCREFRTSEARDVFETFAREIDGAESVSVNILSVDRDGDAASVDFDTSHDDDDSVTRTLRLVYEGGDWRPCGTVRKE